ncbi:hypothetical protein [Glycomyces albidus]|jgi:hypothetical protein|uniref:Uncharacterized protein n=1 Tax=Glycomyces albidus TaxID=2656774 RepID=A0A6L5G994_9ACTN|nr:hypothetical protein [Glycomyces albidus]MQM26138.1 hypothetical protein [Glycomyces albidus]
MNEESSLAFPRQFVWELQQSKYRIYALVDQFGVPSRLEAVLTVKDRQSAALAQHLLNAAVREGRSTYCEALAQRVFTLLPDAPAASLRRALEWVYDLSWPASEDADVPPQAQRVFDEMAAATAGLDRDPKRRARLAELEGPVVRSIQITEVHVHDTPRALAAARARGFEPAPDGERAGNDRHDLLGAISWLLEEDPEPPGTAQYASLGSLERLDPAEGDELVGWSEAPVIEEFIGGWHSYAERGLEPLTSGAGLDEKDEDWQLEQGRNDMRRLAELFPVTDHTCSDSDEVCDECPVELPPRMAHLLQIGLELVGDRVAVDLEEHGDTPVTEANRGQWFVIDQLPRITWVMGRAWRQRFREGAHHLLADLDAGEWPEPRNHAEEMMLALAIEEAKAVYEELLDEVYPEHQELPASPDDYDFELLEELLFQDTDITFLFDPETEAFADPGHPMNQVMGIGDLRPVAWFDYFENVAPRATP